MRSTSLAVALCAGLAAPALADSWTLSLNGFALNHVYRTFEGDNEIISRYAVESSAFSVGLSSSQLANGIAVFGTLDDQGTAIEISEGFNDSLDASLGEYLGTELSYGGSILFDQPWQGYHSASAAIELTWSTGLASTLQFTSVDAGYSFEVPTGGFGTGVGFGLNPFDPGSSGGFATSLPVMPMQGFVDFFGSDLSAIISATWQRSFRFKVDIQSGDVVRIGMPGPNANGVPNDFMMQVPSPAGVGLLGLAGVLASGRRRRS
jgi:hypothetical protein